jgi:hypothetical protein
LAIFDLNREIYRYVRGALTLTFLVANMASPVAAQVPDPVIPDSDAIETSAAHAERNFDAQRIRLIIASLWENKAPPFPVLCTEMPRMFKKKFLRLGKLESIQFQREQKGERVYELWFAGGRLIWGISDPVRPEPTLVRITLLEHL